MLRESVASERIPVRRMLTEQERRRRWTGRHWWKRSRRLLRRWKESLHADSRRAMDHTDYACGGE